MYALEYADMHLLCKSRTSSAQNYCFESTRYV